MFISLAMIFVIISMIRGSEIPLWGALIILSVYIFLPKKIEQKIGEKLQIIADIISSVALSIIFIFILTPLGLISRINNDRLRLKKNYKTLFSEVNKDFGKENFEKMW